MRLAKWAGMVCLVGLIGCIPGCASTSARAPTPVTVQLSWTHQAQFAGFYAADQKGYYAAEGLAVTLVEGGPTVAPASAVESGAAQFGVTSADAMITARADGRPLRVIAAVYRRSPRVYVALASSGITRPQDFAGKKISLGMVNLPMLRMVTGSVGVSPDQYTVVEQGIDLTPLYSGEVDVRGVFLTNEVLAAQAAGYKLNIIYPDDYGIHFYADVLFTRDDVIANNPDLVRRFLRSTLKGWTYAIDNAAAVGAMVLKYAPQADVALENAKMAASIPLVNTGEDYIGWMKPELWNGMEKSLREQGVLTKTVDVTQVYALQFLQEIYK